MIEQSKCAVIMTFYDVSNYGAFLQAFAMQKFLEGHGVDAFLKQHNATGNHLLTRLLRLKTGKQSTEIAEYKQVMKEKMHDCCQRYLKINAAMKHYDVAILGSDEIWNVRNLGVLHYPFFFRGCKSAVRNVAYAACSGKSRKKDLLFFPYAVPGIRKLDAVSVRDERTEALMKEIGVQNVTRVLDPTFLIDFMPYINSKERDTYLFVYTYGLSEDAVERIRAYADNHKLRIVATGSYCPWADENPVPNPFEWVALIQGCTAMVTTTFHGTVFAIQQHKQFLVLGGNSPKVTSALDEFDLLARKCSDQTRLEDIFKQRIDYDIVSSAIRKKTAKSCKFLLEQLNK